MVAYNREFMESATARLEKIAPDAKPLWGEMNPAEMMGHLNMTIIYSLGNLPQMPAGGNFMSKKIIGPLILNGIVKLPKNFTPPRPEGAPAPPKMPGNLEMLKNAMNMYMERVEKLEEAEKNGGPTPEFKVPPHPAFGDIGVRGWGKMHVVHFDHHLRQFGV